MAYSIDWRGASGTSYNFTAFPVGQEFRPVSGVYILCRELLFTGFEALYVGETESFHQRLNFGVANHDGYRRAGKLGMTHIATLIVNGNAERLRIETDLRHGLNPSANAQGSFGGFLDV